MIVVYSCCELQLNNRKNKVLIPAIARIELINIMLESKHKKLGDD